MRFLILAVALAAAACTSEEPQAMGLAAGVYTGGARDALCIAGEAGTQRAGLIVYGEGDANCSASGRIEQSGADWSLVPAGDAECRIALRVDGDRIALGPPAPACAYYCGPTASLAGKSFGRSGSVKPATDLAGDPLC